MHEAPSVAAPVLLALVLTTSGVAKLMDRSSAADAFVSLRLPTLLLRLRAPQILPWAELALAVALLVCSGWAAILVATLAMTLFAAYLVVILRALTFDERVTCSCFGKLGLGSVDRFTAVRNLLLVALAAVTLVDAVQHDAVIARVASFSGADRAWLVYLLIGVALTWLVVGNRSAATSSASASVATAAPAATASAEQRSTPMAIPFGRVHRLDSHTVTLRALARTEDVLLLYVSPTCGSCVPVIDAARTWQRGPGRPRVYLVLPMPATDEPFGLAHPEDFELLFDPRSELFNLFGTATPTGILLSSEGFVAGGPVVGREAISELMADADAAPSTSGDGGRASTQPEQAELEYIRQPTPYALLRTRDDEAVPLVSLADHQPTILLLVSPTCGSCREVISRVPGWRGDLPDVQVAFVVRDEFAAEQIEELLEAPAGELYLDPDGSLGLIFATGTPTLVAFGPDRYLLAGPVSGASEIADAMAEIIDEVRGLTAT